MPPLRSSWTAWSADLRFAWRSLRAAPRPAAAAVLVLALGSGLNTSMLAITYGVLVRPLPYADPSRLVVVQAGGTRLDPDDGVPLAAIPEWQRRLRTAETMAAYATTDYILRGLGEPRVVRAAIVTDQFFDVLGVAPVHGGLLSPGSTAMVVTERLARESGIAAEAIVGRTMSLADRAFVAAGVVSSAVAFPSDRVDVWLLAPDAPAIEWLQGPDQRRFRIVARMAPSTHIDQVRADVRRVLADLKAPTPDIGSADTLHDRLVAPVRSALLVFLVGAALVLVVACANAAGLLVARARRRASVVAVCLALGASRARLLWVALFEGLILGLAGSALGAVFALGSVAAFSRLAAAEIPRIADVRVDGPVLLGSLLVAALVAVLCGAIPALHAFRMDVTGVFRQITDRHSRRAAGLAGTLVVAQIALSVVLLVGAGLLGQTFFRLLGVDIGIDPQRTVASTLMLTDQVGFDGAARQPFVSALLQEIERVPGTHHVAVGTSLPPEQSFLEVELAFGPSRAEARRTGRLVLASVTRDYFAALGIPLIDGRLLDADLGNREGTTILSQSAARAIFEDQDPIGRQVPTPVPGVDAKVLTVVGIVGDVKYRGLHVPAGGTIYVPWQLLPLNVVRLVVRTEGDPLAAAPAIRNAIHRLDPAQPVGDIQPLERVIAESVADRRLHAVLAVGFAGLALLLALVALSAALWHSVAERRRELAIRMALGSDSSRTVRHVVGGGARLVAAGLVAGLVVAALVTRGLAGFLYGLGPLDPSTFLTVAAVVAAVSLLACYLPARSAAAIQPSELLRSE